MVSAMTPVGTSQIICAIRNAVLTSMTWNSVSPPRWIRKMVLIAQISDAASVNKPLVDRYANTTLRGVYAAGLTSGRSDSVPATRTSIRFTSAVLSDEHVARNLPTRECRRRALRGQEVVGGVQDGRRSNRFQVNEHLFASAGDSVVRSLRPNRTGVRLCPPTLPLTGADEALRRRAARRPQPRAARGRIATATGPCSSSRAPAPARPPRSPTASRTSSRAAPIPAASCS